MDVFLAGDPKKSRIKRFLQMMLSVEGIFAIFLFPLTSGVYTGLPISVVKIAFVLSVLLVVRKIIRGKAKLRKVPWFPIFLFLIFGVYIVFRDWPLSFGYPLKKAQVFATYTTWAFLGAILILDTRESVVKFLMASVWITAVLGGLGLMGFATGIQLLYDPNEVERARASVGVGNPIVLARAGCASILIFVWMFLQTKNRKMNYLILPLVFFAIMVIASGSRAPILACIIAGGVLVMSASFSSKAAIRSFKLIIITLLTGVILVAVISNTSKFDDVVDRIGELITSGTQTTTFEYRWDSWERAYDMFLESPATGHGIGSFKQLNFGSHLVLPEERVYPHNIVLELLSETGLVGLFLFSLLHISVYRLLTSRKRRNEDFATSLRGMVFVLWFFCFINALSSGDINDNRVMFCLLGLTANAARWSAPVKSLGSYT